jgi:small subunit ribosomal protein S2
LTNWRTIRSRIDELEDLERRREEGEFELLTKKEALSMDRKIDKLDSRLGGIREMRSLPEALFVVDVQQEETAIHEANLLKIPVVALVDTNCDPSVIDYVIPSNDDAIRAIKLLTSVVADAVLEGKAMRKEEEAEEVVRAEEIPGDLDLSDEELLGEATLAKLQTGEFGAEEEEEPEAEVEEEEGEQDEESEAEAETEAEDEAEDEPGEESDQEESESEQDEEDPEA